VDVNATDIIIERSVQVCHGQDIASWGAALAAHQCAHASIPFEDFLLAVFDGPYQATIEAANRPG